MLVWHGHVRFARDWPPSFPNVQSLRWNIMSLLFLDIHPVETPLGRLEYGLPRGFFELAICFCSVATTGDARPSTGSSLERS